MGEIRRDTSSKSANIKGTMCNLAKEICWQCCNKMHMVYASRYLCRREERDSALAFATCFATIRWNSVFHTKRRMKQTYCGTYFSSLHCFMAGCRKYLQIWRNLCLQVLVNKISPVCQRATCLPKNHSRELGLQCSIHPEESVAATTTHFLPKTNSL